jgi:hypothetical protein
MEELLDELHGSTDFSSLIYIHVIIRFVRRMKTYLKQLLGHIKGIMNL